jgi:hypothetical protein
VVSTQIEERLGIYKSLSEVPTEYRLEAFAGSLEKQDVWAEWNEMHSDSEWKREEARRVKNRWDDYLGEAGTHYAVATPEDVESFIDGLLDEVQLERAYKPYWLFLKRFYHWLVWHTEYPHRYNPVLMASANYPACGEVWDYVMSFDRESFK